MSEAKFILETHDEHNNYVPQLFIFKNDSAIMLNKDEVLELCELTKDI